MGTRRNRLGHPIRDRQHRPQAALGAQAAAYKVALAQWQGLFPDLGAVEALQLCGERTHAY